MSDEQEQCDSFNSWELNGLNSLDLWDYTVELECLQGTEDLQLAAELGKTLLERNKELETALRQHQNVIEDQTQEIEYLTKQTVALREVNDSRLRIYEQLEVSIQDLERANHRLAVDHAADKKHIKSLCANIETLESKCEDLQKIIDDLNVQLEIARRRAERKTESYEKPKDSEQKREPVTPNSKKVEVTSTPLKTITPLPELTKEDEDLLRLSDELRESKVSFAQEQRRVTELEEQLASMVQENNRLQDQLRNWHQREDEPKSMQEEFSILEEVRQGQLCIKCLRGVERDDMSSMLDGDDDDRSAISSLVLTPSGQDSPRDDIVTNKLVKFDNAKEKLLQGIWANKEDGHDNPYRELVQKYEALLEVQLSQVKNIRKNKQNTLPNVHTQSGSLSLQDELQTSGEYSQFNVKDTDEESGHGEEAQKDNKQQKKVETTSRKKIIQTPDFSEAETSSSGFSDETSNKATQTERERPGSFLCTIADGEDYRFSIYDDVSPMDSRFRNRPEYRELFKEIFTILKKAAENKDEGEQLPLLDDTTAGKVPPVTPATEEPPGNFTDDTQSVLSSVMSEQSIPVSDITAPETPTLKEDKEEKPITEPVTKPDIVKNNNKQDKLEIKPIVEQSTLEDIKEKEVEKEKEKKQEKERVLTPLVRQPLEYIAATRKKSRHRNRKHSQDRQGADSPVFPSPPKITYQKSSSKKRRDYRPIEVSPLVKATESEWNGSTMQFYNRNINSPTPSVSGRTGKIYQGWNPETDSWDIKQSTASQEIHKLRKLELSYAEVLRNADKTKTRRKKHQ
ncbi:cerebellar degeneration-related protein 2-like isoform X1 [Galleria mellonella]|uniref:Cerebellar degeneration-related protein 2-like isoform X1 n=1 Tax=Galleria mellonella TaxID=7137 RepID=A0A6J1WXS9_GALME|nr:cerebellar degeneration-related protein 2-like isoform X1 [Galleria mellonella]